MNLPVPWNDLFQAALSKDYAREFTHPLYRYPASMSPGLARALVLGLTKPGETVLDPFCGGGTIAVEALSHGRRIICTDLNSLACFVTQAKAWPLSRRSLQFFQQWVELAKRLLVCSTNKFRSVPLVVNSRQGYVELAPKTHGLLLGLRDCAFQVPDPAARRFATLVVLRVGQICFDCRSKPLYPKVLIRAFETVSSQALNKMYSYSAACRINGSLKNLPIQLNVLQSDAKYISNKLRFQSPKISLVLTSPPYPGVHVLYHRWQIRGRREIGLPYTLVGIQDGLHEADYTLGYRQESQNHSYFEKMEAIFARMRQILCSKTIIAQVIAFSNPEQQLIRFRKTMDGAGYDEVTNPDVPDQIITRVVPHRRWYAVISSKQESAKEYLFIHKPRL